MLKYNRLAFYFVAHADDWQLFMAPEISEDIADKTCKVVIVHTTAGDAGCDEKYWKAREYASVESLLFRISFNPQIQYDETEVAIGNKKLFRISANNCCCYFLRLPDGLNDGSGFPAYQHQSLEKLQKGLMPAICSVDGKTRYAGWKDLSDTIDGIIDQELSDKTSISAENVCLNLPETDKAVNPVDHSDHFYTALLVQSTKAFGRYSKRAFIGYSTIYTNDNLTGEELFWKIGMFCIYHHTVFRQHGHSTIDEDASYIPWSFRKSSCRNL